MPQQHPQQVANALREMQQAQREQDARLRALEGRRLLQMDRAVTAEVPAPVDGQFAVEASSDAAKYYANGEWRDFGGGTDTSYPLMFPLMGPETIDQDSSAWQSFDVGASNPVTYDPKVTGTWRAENRNLSGTITDGAYWAKAVRLGPKGSVWAINIVTDIGPDCGRLRWQIASDNENDPSGFNPTNPGGYLYGLPGSDPTYIDINSFLIGAYDGIDLYNASAGTEEYWNRVCEMRVMGDPGDPLTTVSDFTSDGYDEVCQLDGGPGIYWIRMYVDGKNASSSDVKCPVRGYWLTRRATASGFSV